jgi:hypothetical protein
MVVNFRAREIRGTRKLIQTSTLIKKKEKKRLCRDKYNKNKLKKIWLYQITSLTKKSITSHSINELSLNSAMRLYV